MVTRRTLLTSASVTTMLAALGITPEVLAADRVKLGDAVPFSFGALVERVRAMAGKPCVPPATAPADIPSKIDYEAHGRIKFNTAHTFFADGPGQFPVTSFHLGTFFHVPACMHVVEKGVAREIIYDESHFDMPTDNPARKLPRGSGFAGFRFQEDRLGDQKELDWKKDDWVAFLGVSYFRATGKLYQYGLLARGVTLDVTQAGKPEGFPNFTYVWFDTPTDNRADSVTIYTLLDDPNTTGTYRFVVRHTKGVMMDIDAAIFLRKDVDRFGTAPAISMY